MLEVVDILLELLELLQAPVGSSRQQRHLSISVLEPISLLELLPISVLELLPISLLELLPISLLELLSISLDCLLELQSTNRQSTVCY